MTTEVHIGDNIATNIQYYKLPGSTGNLMLSITDENGNLLYDINGAALLTTSANTDGTWSTLSITKQITQLYVNPSNTILYNGRIFINSYPSNLNANDCWFDNHTLNSLLFEL